MTVGLWVAKPALLRQVQVRACVTAPEVPFALHWDGNSWTGSTASQPSVVSGCSLTSVFMINSGEGWAVGDGGQFFHYTTSTNQWGLVQTLTRQLRPN